MKGKTMTNIQIHGNQQEQKKDIIKKIEHVLGKITQIMEIIVAIIVLMGFVFSIVPLFNSMKDLADGANEYTFHEFLSYALTLVIGIEFIRMLVKHSWDSVLNVLLFAIARHIILEASESIDLLIGVLAICIIFLTHKFFSPQSPYLNIFNTKDKREDKDPGLEEEDDE